MANHENTAPEQDEVKNTIAEEQCDAGQTADAEPGIEALQSEVDQLKQQLNDAREQALRAQAEMQNSRRRAEQDVEKAHRYALEKFAGELLPIVDNLERAIQSSQGDTEHLLAVREGVEMTLDLFVKTLEKFNVGTVHPVGEDFNPDLHQAVTMIPHPEMDANKVVDVMMKGYTLNGRLLRPAMVVVSKGKA